MSDKNYNTSFIKQATYRSVNRMRVNKRRETLPEGTVIMTADTDKKEVVYSDILKKRSVLMSILIHVFNEYDGKFTVQEEKFVKKNLKMITSKLNKDEKTKVRLIRFERPTNLELKEMINEFEITGDELNHIFDEVKQILKKQEQYLTLLDSLKSELLF